MFYDVLSCFPMFSDCFLTRWLQDFSRMIISNERSKETRWSQTIEWSQLLDDPPAIWWSPAIRWSPAIQWSIGSMDFDNPKVYGDTSITDGLVFFIKKFRIGKKVHMQYININIFTWFWQTMSDVQKKFFKVSQSGIFRRCEKIWFF